MNEALKHTGWPGDGDLAFRLGGHEALASACGLIVIPGLSLMAVADLHFEKAAAFARRGQLLPPYDTEDTLLRLERAIARYRPHTLIALGDSFHDPQGEDGLSDALALRLRALTASVSRFIWISGNHDPQAPERLGGEGAMFLEQDGLIFCHEPNRTVPAGQIEISGHLHPMAVIGRGDEASARRGVASTRVPCLAGDATRLILPAYGSLAGGLSLAHKAFSGLFGNGFYCIALGRQRAYRVDPARVRR